ncbi:MAG: aminotransferase class III-fold pyridoxal phosphate-dependent enzyme [Planctomycetes bacterium]|nr:aminotransferase class III-fold pyridoxal phosphate-dependent enzyme [Planctomycetota bacterium]
MFSPGSNPLPAEQENDWIGPAPQVMDALPGPKAEQLVRRDVAITSPSNTREYALVVKRACGSVVEDIDGNRFLDFAAGIAVCATGHCHPKVVEAIQKQAADLIHICGSDFYYPVMVELAEKLGAIAPWAGQDKTRVYFTNSGTEVIEAAIKLARHRTGRKRIIAFHGAFHGRTMGALALTASKFKQKLGFGPLIPMVSHAKYGTLDDITGNLFTRHFPSEEVAAIFVEPIQGEGGYNIPPKDFLPALRQLCDQHGILMVADEIQSGIGRTGKWWACQHDGVIPDIICSAKGLASGMPLGALITKDSVMNWPPGAQGSTFGGNPVCCAAALATIGLVEGGYMENAAKMGEIVQAGLRKMTERHRCMARVRGRGLMIGFDIVRGKNGEQNNPDLRDRIIQEAFNRGLLLLPCGETAIRITPPLCINETQIDVGLKVLDEVLATLGK